LKGSIIQYRHTYCLYMEALTPKPIKQIKTHTHTHTNKQIYMASLHVLVDPMALISIIS
jgi:hypothetical protein